jgi:activating signal cointegrator complex subunit 3
MHQPLPISPSSPPTTLGKTISSELALLHMFSCSPPGSKAIYIAPLKALVRERIEDWSKGLCARLGKKMVELTGRQQGCCGAGGREEV